MSFEGPRKKAERLEPKNQGLSLNRRDALRAALLLLVAPNPSPTEARPRKREAAPPPELPPAYKESSLQPENIRGMREAAFTRLENNVGETAGKILGAEDRAAFIALQKKRLADLKIVQGSSGMYIPSRTEILEVIKDTTQIAEPFKADMAAFHKTVQTKGVGILINAGKNQRMYLVKNTDDGLEFMLGARVTTGEDGISFEPGSSNASRAGLQFVEAIRKDNVVSGENVAYNAKEKPGGHLPVTTLTKTGARKTIYIAEVGVANVGLIAYRLADKKGLNIPGQALHAGPLRKNAASHGCTRTDEITALSLETFITAGTPVMIYEGADTRVEVKRTERSERAQVEKKKTQPPPSRPEPRRTPPPGRSSPEPAKRDNTWMDQVRKGSGN